MNTEAFGQVKAASNYPIGMVGNTVPREIGFVDRAHGIAGSAQQVRESLEALMRKIDGTGEQIDDRDKVCFAPGLPSLMSEAEGQLRTCLSILSELHARF